MRIKLHRDGVEWGGPDKCGDLFYYFYWWNWLPKSYRHLGFKFYWYDGPIATFGFWFFNWCWSTPWTCAPKGYWD